jgi:hypothetical protein
MSNSREQLIMVLRAGRTRRKQSRVEERVRCDKCLGTNRDGSECDKQATRRGLCENCYRAWMSSVRGMNPEQKAAAESRLISAGALLGDREVLRIKNRSVFVRLA